MLLLHPTLSLSTQAMIRVHTRQSEQRFDHVKPAHLVFRLLDLAAQGEPANVIVGVFLAADEIAVER